jgi:hypothetical protein
MHVLMSSFEGLLFVLPTRAQCQVLPHRPFGAAKPTIGFPGCCRLIRDFVQSCDRLIAILMLSAPCLERLSWTAAASGEVENFNLAG